MNPNKYYEFNYNGEQYIVPREWIEEHDKQIRAEVIAEISREMRLLYGNEYEQQIRAEVIEECARIIENSKTLFENHQTETIMRTKDKCITMIRNLKEQNK